MECGCAERHERSYRFRRDDQLTPTSGSSKAGAVRCSQATGSTTEYSKNTEAGVRIRFRVFSVFRGQTSATQTENRELRPTCNLKLETTRLDRGRVGARERGRVTRPAFPVAPAPLGAYETPWRWTSSWCPPFSLSARRFHAMQPFADAGKAVRTGHSGAAVSGNDPPFMSLDMEHSQSGAILGEGGGEERRSNVAQTRSPNISLRTKSTDPPCGGARMISSNQ